MESIWLIIFLHNLRYQALGRHLFTRHILGFEVNKALRYSTRDVRRGRDIADELAPVDLVVDRLYYRWMQERGFTGMGHGLDFEQILCISNLCLNVTATLEYRQEYVPCFEKQCYTDSW